MGTECGYCNILASNNKRGEQIKQLQAENERLETIIDNRAEDREVADKYKQLQAEKERQEIHLQQMKSVADELQDELQAELAKVKETRNSDLYVEFGDGKISVMTTEDNKLILSKQLGVGEIGKKNIKNIESLMVVKDAIEDIEQALKAEVSKE